jgi:hypothetical protein
MPSYIKLQEMVDRVKKIKTKETGKEAIPMVIVGTHYDQVSERIVSSKNSLDTGFKYKCPVIESSAIPSEKQSVVNVFKAAVLEVWKEKTTSGTLASQQVEEKLSLGEKLKRLSIRPSAEKKEEKQEKKSVEKTSRLEPAPAVTHKSSGRKDKSSGDAGRAAIVFTVSVSEISEPADGAKGVYYQVLREKEGKIVKLTTSPLAPSKNPRFDEVAVTAARLLTKNEAGSNTWNTKLTLRFFFSANPDVVIGEASFDLDSARKAGQVDLALKKSSGQVVGAATTKIAFRKGVEADNEEETEVDVGTIRSAKPSVPAPPRIQVEEAASSAGAVEEAPLSLVVSIPRDNIRKPMRFTTTTTGEDALAQIAEQTGVSTSSDLLVHAETGQILQSSKQLGSYSILKPGDTVEVKPKRKSSQK